MFEVIESTEIFIKNTLEHGGSDGHDFDHTMRVVRHALQLCDELPVADRNIVHIAALLHDVARPEEFQSQGRIDHAVLGAEKARDFLLSINVNEEIANKAAEAISQHRFRSGVPPSTLEAAILFDADKLDSLGAVGIGRAFLFAGRAGARLHNSAEEALASAPYSSGDTAYREYLVKLSKVQYKMLTEPGKKKAALLSVRMDEFFRQLNAEIFA